MEAADEERPLLLRDHVIPSDLVPPQQNGSGKWRACAMIMGTELSEVLAFAGISKNLVTYLTGVLHESNVAAAADVSTWMSTCFLTPLLGAFLADSYWGRYKTIVVCLSIYTLGLITLALSATAASLPAVLLSMASRRAVAFLGLYLVALGVGGIKPCVSPLGAEQFDDADPGERDAKASFFNWYFFCVNTGALLGSTVLVWVQDRVSWWLCFGVPAAVMAIALVVFVSGRRLYRLRQVDPTCTSPLTRVCQVAVAAVRKRHVQLPAGDYSQLLLHDKLLLPSDGSSCKIEHTDQFRFLDKAAVVVASPGAAAATANAWSLCTVTQVEEVKMLLRVCSVWPTVVFFFAVSTQTSTTFLEQGAAMDTRLIGAFHVPPAALSSVQVASVLLSIPAYEAVLLPLARRVTGEDRGITLLQRLGIGLALATLTMAYMALLEMKRQEAVASTPVSIVWQAPAYFVMGAAEVFTSVGLIEFYYDQSPDAMKSLCTAVSLLAVAAGNYLNSVIVAVVARATTWIPEDLNQGRLDCFFWMMALLSSVNMLAFLSSAMRYKYREE